MRKRISKSNERKELSKSDSFFLKKDDYIARFNRGDNQVIYVSNSEVICLGEYVIDNHCHGEHFVVVYEFEPDKCYSAVIRNERVISELIGSKEQVIDEHEYDIYLGKSIVSNVNCELPDVDLKLIDDIDLNEIDETYITSNVEAQNKYGRAKRNKCIAFVAGLICVVGGFFYTQDEPKKVQRYVDIYATYKADIDTQIDALHAIQQACYLFALSMTLPDGLEMSEIKKVGMSLVMTFKSSDVLIALIEQWLNDNPEIKPFYSNKQVTVALNGSANRWSKEIVPIVGFAEYLHDSALDLGAVNVAVPDVVNNDRYQQTSIKAHFTNKEIGAFSLYSELLKDTPSFLTSLRITPSQGKSSLANVEFDISIKGKHNE